jgi:hypothetical protein
MAGIGDPVDDPIVDALKSNAGLAVAVATGVLVVTRLLSVTNFQTDVALALLASAGVGNVVIGTAVTSLAVAAPILGIALYDVGMAFYRAGRRAVVSVSLAPLLFGFGVLLTPTVVALAVLGAFIGSQLTGKALDRMGKPIIRKPDTPLGYWFTLAFPILTFAALFSGPWMPAEAIDTAGRTVVGYVTSVEGDWTQVLTYQPRSVESIRSDTITRRYLCSVSSWWGSKSLLDLVRPTTAPACPLPPP